MAGRKAGSPSRSEFIRKQLAAKPEAKLAEVNEAWKKAGNSGDITATLFYQVKSKAGHAKPRTGKRRGRPPGRPAGSVAVASSPARSHGGGSYLSIEATLDSLIATAESLGDRTLADSLRTTRRVVSAKLV